MNKLILKREINKIKEIQVAPDGAGNFLKF